MSVYDSAKFVVFFLPRQSSGGFFLFSDSATNFFVTVQYYINSLLLQLPFAIRPTDMSLPQNGFDEQHTFPAK